VSMREVGTRGVEKEPVLFDHIRDGDVIQHDKREDAGSGRGVAQAGCIHQG
jgi:hypothetical protein